MSKAGRVWCWASFALFCATFSAITWVLPWPPHGTERLVVNALVIASIPGTFYGLWPRGWLG